MKAVVYERYGGPDVVALREVDTPSPGSKEILIKILATTVTSADWRARSLIVPPGLGLIARIAFGVIRPKKPVLGTELAGEVVALGPAVSRFKVGDPVIAFPGLDFGCHAQFRTMREDGLVVTRPPTLLLNEAAALSFGGLTALFFLRDKAGIQPADKVLIIGASGCVGSTAVQLAKYFGAEVTGVCSSANLDLVTSTGADHVIDYTSQDFTQSDQAYDIIFDTVGATTIAQSIRSLTKGGRLLLAAEGLSQSLRIPWTNLTSGRKVFAGTANSSVQDLRFLVKLAEKGKFSPVIDRVYPLEKIAQAHQYVGTKRKRGNVVITVAHDAR